jgi:Arc/MetJ family transcription regulator
VLPLFGKVNLAPSQARKPPRSRKAIKCKIYGRPAGQDDADERNLSKPLDHVYNNAGQYTWEVEMRTNVVIDDDLMESALKLSGLKTKKDAIEEGLKLLVQVKSQEAIRAFRGKLKWAGSLDEMRLDK